MKSGIKRWCTVLLGMVFLFGHDVVLSMQQHSVEGDLWITRDDANKQAYLLLGKSQFDCFGLTSLTYYNRPLTWPWVADGETYTAFGKFVASFDVPKAKRRYCWVSVKAVIEALAMLKQNMLKEGQDNKIFNQVWIETENPNQQYIRLNERLAKAFWNDVKASEDGKPSFLLELTKAS